MLDTFGLGPVETPSRIVFSKPVFTLKAYGAMHCPGPVLLMVPAPIKRAYLWDLDPGASVVRECLRYGIQAYMIQWEDPGYKDQGLGLRAYADHFILTCIDSIKEEIGEGPVFLAGHSLGGTFSAIFTSLHNERITGLILIGAPILFGPDVGDLDSLVARLPRADMFTEKLHSIPGAFISFMSNLASPESFQAERLSDLLLSLPDPDAMQMHMRVVRWTLDELPMTSQLFEDIVELLYRENSFMNGTLEIDGRHAAPASVKTPILSMADRRSHVVPPRSTLAFHEASASRDKKVLWYAGDVGVALQHAGMLVGKNAHEHLWPQIMEWIRSRAKIS